MEFAAIDPSVEVHVFRGDGTHHLDIYRLEAGLRARKIMTFELVGSETLQKTAYLSGITAS